MSNAVKNNCSTPDLCDQFPDDVKILDPVFLDFGGRKSFYGEVVTIKCFEDNSLVKDQLAKSGHGKVLVVDGGGSRRRALMGDLIATEAVHQGWEGVIIYGSVRDVEVIGKLDLGVKALGAIPLKTERRGLGDLGIEINFAGQDIRAGSFIYADSNGIVVSSKKLIG